ncbi:hypothetical protein FJT64_015855 [Amphibalanus amphitrite]|uniref:Uncharacterized protein n=1 Tax=Amphibalanus amphitrite TaxID=1232801 RepID=A0A6A4XG19_AMPAM|nr:hypothetical protein FJT64_015855 [Amphibalanus amphitrite]
MDGSSGHSRWKQAGDIEDDQVMVASVVPLRITDERGAVVWYNHTPNSNRFCRPISVKFLKENRSTVLKEMELIQTQIAALRPLKLEHATCRYSLSLTMVDGKVVNLLTET